MEETSKPTILVTNDDGIHAPCLRALVQVLVAAPDCEKSAVSHCITWLHRVTAKQVNIHGATAFAISGSPADSISLGISKEIFLTIADLVRLGVKGKSDPRDFTLAAHECLPIIRALLVKIKNQRYHQRCFLNIDVPTNVASHKGYKLTKQGENLIELGWKQVTSETQGQTMTSAMTMDTETATPTETNPSSISPEHLIFKREVRGAQYDPDDNDCKYLQEGYITVTPLAALANAEVDCHAYFKDW